MLHALDCVLDLGIVLLFFFKESRQTLFWQALRHSHRIPYTL